MIEPLVDVVRLLALSILVAALAVVGAIYLATRRLAAVLPRPTDPPDTPRSDPP